jgi:hypothetical protein
VIHLKINVPALVAKSRLYFSVVKPVASLTSLFFLKEAYQIILNPNQNTNPFSGTKIKVISLSSLQSEDLESFFLYLLHSITKIPNSDFMSIEFFYLALNSM